MRIGTAGWSIPAASKPLFPGQGALLARYARRFGCVEINSSFYRSHRASTYAAWAAQTPADFRFSVKLPKTITHTQRLLRARAPLEQFLGEIEALGERLGALLVQLPPSLAFDARVAGRFFELMRGLHAGPIVCEPRHPSWFDAPAEQSMIDWHIGRAAADPAPDARAAHCGGWRGPPDAAGAPDATGALAYHRWHGSPRMYWSGYGEAWMAARAAEASAQGIGSCGWFIFDNTAAGHALPDALAFQELVARGAAGAADAAAIP